MKVPQKEIIPASYHLARRDRQSWLHKDGKETKIDPVLCWGFFFVFFLLVLITNEKFILSNLV